jgi:UTP--glucose-1-phosphate uridylyltransferase
LPVVDTPTLEYVVAEAAAAGIADVLLVTGRGQESVVDHFDTAPALEDALERKGDTDALAAVRRSTGLARVLSVRQHAPRGLGHAIGCGAAFVGDEPFAVLLGDEFMHGDDPVLATMLDVQAERGGIVVALVDVPRAVISRYGSAVAEPTDRADVVRVTGRVEKPAPDEAPSTLAVVGRYVLPPEVFAEIARTAPGVGGEIQITDAMAALIDAGVPAHGVVFTGRRFDTGDRGEYLKAIVALACERPDLGPGFRTWLTEFVRSGA